MIKKLLVAIDASDASLQALTYLVNMFDRPQRIYVRIFHVLPPIPPQLREHGGSEDPDRELALGEALREAQYQWIEEAKQEAQPVMDRARDILLEGGVSPDNISMAFSPSVLPSEIVCDVLQEATAWNCGTIVVGRGSYTKFQELFHRHIGEELVHKGLGFAIWVVE